MTGPELVESRMRSPPFDPLDAPELRLYRVSSAGPASRETPMMVKIGFAEVLLANGTRAQGHYEVTLTRDGAVSKGGRTRASGVIRLGDDARTLTDVNRALLVRFDRKIELLVRVSGRLHEADLIHFTSEDAAALEDRPESVNQQLAQLSQRL